MKIFALRLHIGFMKALAGILSILVLLGSSPVLAQQQADSRPPRVGLVLSGGGGRGFSHLGVLRMLEEEGIPLYCVVGTSMGAVVGGLYASGYSPAEIDSLLGRYSWDDMFRDRPDRPLMYTGRKDVSDRHLVEFRLQGLKPRWARSLSTGQRVSQALAEMVWRAPVQGFGDFDRLRMRFRAVATDLESGMRVEMGGGDLAEAMRASMSVPLLLQPVEMDGRLLVDGGIVSNIPVESARKLGAELVIAVDVTSPLRERGKLKEAWELADQVVGIMQAGANQRSREAADILLLPDLPPDPMNVVPPRELQIQAGENAMRGELAHLRRLMTPSPLPAEHNLPVSDACSLRVEVPDGEGWRVLQAGQACPNGSDLLLKRALQRDTWTREERDLLCQDLRRCGCFEMVQLLEEEATPDGVVLRLRPYPPVRHSVLLGTNALRRHERGAVWRQMGLDSLLATMEGGPRLRAEALDSLSQELEERLHRAGFALATVDSVQQLGDTLAVHVDPGILHELRTDGLRRLKPEELLKEFQPRAGELFIVDDADRSIRRLFATGLFDQVYLRLEREGRRNVAVIHAQDRDFPVLRAGLRYGSAREGEGFVQLLWENLLRRSLRGDLQVLVGARRQEQRAALERDRIWRSLLTARFGLSHTQQQLWLRGEDSPHPDGQSLPFERENFSLHMRAGQQIQGLGTVFASTALEWDEEGAQSSHWHRRLLRLGLQSVVDSRDRRGLTRTGELHKVSFEQLVDEEGEKAYRLLAEIDSWRSLGRHTAQLGLLVGSTDSPARQDHFEFGGDPWLRSLHPIEAAGRQALGLRACWRSLLKHGTLGDWHASLRWSALALSDELDQGPRREDLLQEATLVLHLESRLGELSLGLARLTEHAREHDPGLRLWVDLGYSF